MKTLIPLAGLALLAAGCEAPTSTPRDVAPADSRPATGTPVPPQPPGGPAAPAAAPTILSGLSRADFENRLRNGAGCSLSRGGAELVVAVIGDAVARVDGEVVDLTGAPLREISDMARGGRFEGGGAVIRIDAAPDLGEAVAGPESSLSRPVRVTATSGGRHETFDAVWTCAS
ncbi:hypothetical protein [Brevundimonas sp.]|uniref:hypothetical protein n=1 Tax=Brevundimonas sp. TaxID=1871086 RepID=UPI002D3470EA|nr:hypothetical protein [Brevundimonas sp.]HYC96993.1 hypothetical protein [Brevundimonas sp.]